MDEITSPFKSPFIGVATQSALASPELKRWLLLFDEVVVDDLEIAIRLASSDGEYKAAELEWLAGQGLLSQCKFDELPPLKDSRYSASLMRLMATMLHDWHAGSASRNRTMISLAVPRTALRATPAESSRGIDYSVRGSQEE
jgi:hypothetical protein